VERTTGAGGGGEPAPRGLTREFSLYLGSRFCGGAAMTMLRSVVAWHVFALSGSAFQLGLIGLVQFIPALLLSLVGGAAADMLDRRRIIMAAQTVPLACAVLLSTATARGHASLLLLYVAVLVVAVAAAFENPARAALLPTLVPRSDFPRAVTIASTAQALAFVTGPAAAGFVIATGGIAAAYGVYGGLLVCSLGSLAVMRLPARQRVQVRIEWQVVREGLSFVRRREVVLGCMTLDMFAVIFGGATALLPIYAEQILQVGARGYGVLSASTEVGALLSSLVLMRMPPIRRAGRALVIAVAVYGVATIVFGLSRSFPLSVLAYLVVGIADQVSVVMRGTAIQLSTPDELRGRVSAVNFIFIGASNQLGAVESGFVAALTSATFAVVSGGVASLAVLALIALKFPALRSYRVDREGAA
jgi:MFS family permease